MNVTSAPDNVRIGAWQLTKLRFALLLPRATPPKPSTSRGQPRTTVPRHARRQTRRLLGAPAGRP